MKVLIAGHDEMSRLLPMEECIDVIADMFKALASGHVILPLRQVVSQPDKKGVLALMPAYLGSPRRVIGGKFVTVFPENSNTKYESHQGCILLFECGNGKLLAIIDASYTTAVRTAAASAVATRALARVDASNLAILGSGSQALMHLAAMQRVRTIKRVRVWSRNKEHAKQFANRQSESGGGPTVEVTDSVAEAVLGADLICTTTGATSPILKGEWLSSGCHINAVGASRPPSRELDSEAVAKSRLYTDRIESLINEADDFRIPLKEGIIKNDHLVGEIGGLLTGKISGRRNEKEITLFKSLGIATEDLAAAYHVYEKAESNNIGTWVELNAEKSPYSI